MNRKLTCRTISHKNIKKIASTYHKRGAFETRFSDDGVAILYSAIATCIGSNMKYCSADPNVFVTYCVSYDPVLYIHHMVRGERSSVRSLCAPRRPERRVGFARNPRAAAGRNVRGDSRQIDECVITQRPMQLRNTA